MPNDINILPATYLLYIKCTLLDEALEKSVRWSHEIEKKAEPSPARLLCPSLGNDPLESTSLSSQ